MMAAMVESGDVWRLVDEARSSVPDPFDADEVAAAMVRSLSARAPADIIAFAQPLEDLRAAAHLGGLWAAAYTINGGASDDGFDDFRGWLIAQGRETYERALADPDSLAGHPAVLAAAAAGEDLEGEEVLYVAAEAYRAATGEEDLPDDAYTVAYRELDPDWNFDFDDEAEMRRRLPRLVALHDGDEED